MNKKKVAILATSVALLGAVGIGSTLAYFSDKTGTLNNTFTLGGDYEDGDLTLVESNVEQKANKDYEKIEGTTTTGNDYLNLMPGSHVYKDPTVTLDADIDSYLFIKVTGMDEAIQNGMILEEVTDAGTAIDLKTKWTKIADDGSVDEGNSYNGYYFYNGSGADGIIEANPDTNPDVNSMLFDGLSVATDLDLPENAEKLAALQSGVDIDFKAAVIQADGIHGSETQTPLQVAFSQVKGVLDAAE